MIARILTVAAVLAAVTGAAGAAEVTINKISADGIGEAVGTVALADGPQGLTLTPKLKGLPPGPHGFHVHQNPDCAPGEADGKKVPGLAAGGHYDPAKAGAHKGPQADGHLGDLPLLMVKEDGTAAEALTAPRLKLADVQGRALMIHAGGDNYADQPAPLGGGGGRIACGVVK